MKKQKILVVAHPDDEILFFSSLLGELDRIIICFGPCSDQSLSKGRERLQRSFPLKNVEWLNMEEANVYLSVDWKNPRTNADGLCVDWNSEKYHQNYEYLTNYLERELEDCAIVYTHNPWGEYGHEDHVSVFNAVLNGIKEGETEMYVSGYVSGRSENLFKRQQYFLDAEILLRSVPRKLCAEMKQLYMSHGCWTWNDYYEWPDIEMFCRIRKGETPGRDHSPERSALRPVMYFTDDFPQGNLKRLAKKMLPAGIQNFIKPIVRKALK